MAGDFTLYFVPILHGEVASHHFFVEFDACGQYYSSKILANNFDWYSMNARCLQKVISIPFNGAGLFLNDCWFDIHVVDC